VQFQFLILFYIIGTCYYITHSSKTYQLHGVKKPLISLLLGSYNTITPTSYCCGPTTISFLMKWWSYCSCRNKYLYHHVVEKMWIGACTSPLLITKFRSLGIIYGLEGLLYMLYAFLLYLPPFKKFKHWSLLSINYQLASLHKHLSHPSMLISKKLCVL